MNVQDREENWTYLNSNTMDDAVKSVDASFRICQATTDGVTKRKSKKTKDLGLS
jgi:hypothetical protein